MQLWRTSLLLSWLFVALPAAQAASGSEAETAQGQRIIVKWKSASANPSAQALNDAARRFRAASGVDLQSGGALDSRRQLMRFGRSLSTTELQSALQTLRKQPDVEYAEIDQRRYVHAAVAPNDTYFTATTNRTGQWYLQSSEAASINAINAWGVTQGSNSIVVAVLDTGVRFDHPDLSGKLLAGYDFVSGESTSSFLTANDGDGWDPDPSDPGDWVSKEDIQNHSNVFPSSLCSPTSSSWHGTRVSGIIGAATNNGAGIAGTAWNTMILPVRVIGKCDGYDSDILAAMRWAAGLAVAGVPTNTHPAKVINLSLGGSGSCTSAYQDVIDEVRALGVVIVASAGNEGGPTDSPANCRGVIGVAGLRNQGDKVGYSSLGTAVSLAAPAGNCGTGSGCAYSIDTTYNLGTLDTTTSCPTSTDASAHCYTTPGANSYTDQSNTNLGTSFSAPLVSGVAALMYAVNPHLTPDSILSRLQSTASTFPSVTATTCHVPASSSDIQQSQCNCTTSTCGAGMLNAYNAVLASQKPIINISGPTALSVGQSITLDGTESAAADSNALTYAWSVKSGGATLATANQSTAVVTASAAGTAVISLSVTDDLGNVSSQDWTLTIAASGVTTATYSVGGTVSGLSGSGLVLLNNGGNKLTIAANGNFSFSTNLASGQSYAVSVKAQPTNPAQTCAVSNPTGTISNANVTIVTVTCTTNSYTVGGTVSGLSGSGLMLQNNSGDNLSVTANGSFSFANAVASGGTYDVSVATAPSNPVQTCTVANGSGTVTNAGVTNITVSCTTNTYTIGGTVTGLSGSGLVLQNNGANNLSVAANGTFVFSNSVTSGSAYAVTVSTQPSGQTCSVTNGAGNISNANITNVAVSCSTSGTTSSASTNSGGGGGGGGGSLSVWQLLLLTLLAAGRRALRAKRCAVLESVTCC